MRITARAWLWSALLLGAAFNLSASSPARAGTRHSAHHFIHHAAYHHTAFHHTAYHHTAYHHAAYHRTTYRHTAYYHRDAPHLATGHYEHRVRYARYRHSGLQCVPYAREISHVGLSGDAFLWWAEASGRYARGALPAVGAVLNFRPIHRMPLGHVAVVTAVLNSRTILVTQANWVRGAITNDVTVQDVSPDNDWTQVEVELGDSTTWGAPYPTYGFIYDRPDTSTVIARNGQSNEVAEAPVVAPVSNEAPNRNLQ
ncbi:CHAP domain-containing protein [Acidocella sp.]|uniref:CHAP domain-containing protein n=1 Tax=Acidocella sp. TaxID=50710 RepID=UPI002607FA69|nr:CHAP domain-containing protein [Acidocella sp.]